MWAGNSDVLVNGSLGWDCAWFLPWVKAAKPAQLRANKKREIPSQPLYSAWSWRLLREPSLLCSSHFTLAHRVLDSQGLTLSLDYQPGRWGAGIAFTQSRQYSEDWG